MIFSLGKVELQGVGTHLGGRSQTMAAGCETFSPYQRGSRHAEEIHESVAQPTDIREANSGGCAVRALEWEQQTRRKHVDWRAQTGGEEETVLKCKCCSHYLRLLEEYLAESSYGLTAIISSLYPCNVLLCKPLA